MSEQEAFFAAVDRLYAAALDRDLWSEALRAVAVMFGGQAPRSS